MNKIFNKYNTDKNEYGHNYIRYYEKIIPLIKNPKYLEIGVQNGDSVKAFREYFEKETIIVGLDINNDSKKYEDKNNNLHIEIGDGTDNIFLENIIKKYGTFNIILDDGSHTNRDVIKTFESLFPLLDNNGIYIIEDTITYKSKRHFIKGYPNHLEYFTKFIPYLNQWCIDDGKNKNLNTITDPFKIIKKTNNYFEASIDKIEFGSSYICIYKKVRTHWL